MPKVKLPSGVALVKNPSSNIPFGISANSYENILAGLRDEENWKSLILSNTDLYNNSDVKVKGGLTVQEWVASWNLNPGYTNITVSGDELNGYNVNGNTYVKVGSSIGVNNTLYFSHVSAFKNCYSYRLSSKCTNGKVYIVKGNYTGVLTVGFGDSGVGVRPCVFIPSSIEFDTSGDVWTIAN